MLIGGWTRHRYETYSKVLEAREALPWRPDEELGHVGEAWDARPDLDSLHHLADVAEQLSPFVAEVKVLIPLYYRVRLAVMDNFASDEIAATLGVMAVAFGLAFVLGQAVGLWVRKVRPGLIARMLQRWGARTFRHWYVRNLPDASSSSLYAAAVSASSATSRPYSPSPSKMAPPWRRVSSGQGGE